jgi:ribose 1,5-bisphosphokinase PhnN
MTDQEQVLKRLKNWVNEHPEDADVHQINITTQKEFTLRGILDKLHKEQEKQLVILDEGEQEIVGHIDKWLGGGTNG